MALTKIVMGGPITDTLRDPCLEVLHLAGESVVAQSIFYARLAIQPHVWESVMTTSSRSQYAHSVLSSHHSFLSLSSIMAPAKNAISVVHEPEVLAIASLTTSIFSLINTGSVFLTRLAKLRTKTRITRVIHALSPLEPARREALWLVQFIQQYV